MFIVLFIIWLLLNSYFALDIKFLEIVLFGLALSGLIYFFMIKFTKWNFKMDIFFLKHIHLFIAFYCVLFINIIISNFKVLGLIIKPGARPTPQIVKINVDIQNEFLRDMVSNSITITPGTITIEQRTDGFVVHCLKKEYIEGFENSLAIRILKRMEAK